LRCLAAIKHAVGFALLLVIILAGWVLEYLPALVILAAVWQLACRR
jgi:hypothetical protein